MNRFDTVKLTDGTIATIIGIERLLGEATGHALVSIIDTEGPIIVSLNDTTLIKKYATPALYPHIDDQAV